jgi:hypothetical protein
MRTPATHIDMPSIDAVIAALDDAPSRGYQMLHAPEVSAQDLGYHRLAHSVACAALVDLARAAYGHTPSNTASVTSAGAPRRLTPGEWARAEVLGAVLEVDQAFSFWAGVLGLSPTLLVEHVLHKLAHGQAVEFARMEYLLSTKTGDNDAA